MTTRTATALLLGLLISAPALHGALVAGSIPTEQALTRTALALVAALFAVRLLHGLLRTYSADADGAGEGPEADRAPGPPARRAGDLPGSAGPTTTAPRNPLEAQP